MRSGVPQPSDAVAAPEEAGSSFRLCQLAAGVIERRDRDAGTTREPVAPAEIPDLPWARRLLAAIEQRIADGHQHLAGLVPAVQAEIAVATAECDADATDIGEPSDPLFRLRIGRWGMTTDDLADLICVRDPCLRALAFDFDVTALTAVRTVDDLATPPPALPTQAPAPGPVHPRPRPATATPHRRRDHRNAATRPPVGKPRRQATGHHRSTARRNHPY